MHYQILDYFSLLIPTSKAILIFTEIEKSRFKGLTSNPITPLTAVHCHRATSIFTQLSQEITINQSLQGGYIHPHQPSNILISIPLCHHQFTPTTTS
jgi:hypothetical protein